MKKSIIMVISIIIFIFVVSCNNNTTNTSDNNEISKSIHMLDDIEITTDITFSNIMCLDRIDDTVFVFGQLIDNSYGGFTSDIEMKNTKGFSFEADENEIVVTAAQVTRNDKAILTYKNGITCIYLFDINGNETNVIECSDILSDEIKSAKLVACEKNFYINVNNEDIYYVDSSDNYNEAINLKGNDILGLTKNRENIPTVILSDIEGKISIAAISGNRLEDEFLCNNMSSSALAMCSGIGDYSIIGVFYDAMYGLKEKEWTKLYDFTDKDFKTYDIQDIIMTSETSYILGVFNGKTTSLKLMKHSVASQTNDTDATNKEAVKVAVFGNDPELENIIRKYNQKSVHYKVEAIDYGSNSKEIYDSLQRDIISGNSPDVIPENVNISPNSAYADLYKFIDNDPDFSRNKFIPNILKSMEIDGKLPIISPAFKIETAFAKSKYPYIKENQTYENFIEAYNSIPDDMDFFYQWDKQLLENNFMKCIILTDYVNYEKAECNFNSKDFISFMKFFKENHIGLTSNESSGLFSSNSIGNPMAISQDKQLFSIKTISGMNSIWAEINGEFKDEDITIAGIPSLSGCGSYAVPTKFELSIPANASNQEGGWDFIKWFFSDEISKQYYRTNFSIIQDIFERNASKCLVNDPENVDMVYITDDKEPTEVYYTNDEFTDYFILAPMTQPEIEKYTNYVYDTAKNYVRQDHELIRIINDEIERYFNNEISAEDAARIIQDRTSIYLSEQFG